MCLFLQKNIFLQKNDMNYLLNININRLMGSRIITDRNEDTGELEEGVFIPFDDMSVRVYKKSGVVHILLFANECTNPSHKGTHIISQTMSKEKSEKIESLGRKPFRFIGTMKPTRY